jgi:hypothetical protein
MEMGKMNPERYPWDRLGPGAEPELAPDFASRVMNRARIARERAKIRRRVAAGAICGGLVLGLVFLAGHRPATAPQATLASAPHSAAVAGVQNQTAVSESDTASLDVASAYAVAKAYGVEMAGYEQVAGAQNGAAAQEPGDVFADFLPAAADVAAFESSYATTANRDWAYDPGWDSNS